MDWKLIVKRNIPWLELSKLEEECFQSVLSNKRNKYLILSEPRPTYTYGRNAKETDLLWAKEKIESEGAVIAKAPRGGKWTYHGPGQILLFPIFHLPTQGYDKFAVRLFMDRFRKSIQRSMSSMGFDTVQNDEPFGLFKNDAKLVSFGLSFRNGISMHGASIYITPQHRRFQAINPCGVLEGKVTSLQEHASYTTWEDPAAVVIENVKMGLIPA